jgi:hypothetical protein
MDRIQAALWAFPAAFGVHVAEEAAGNAVFHAATRAPGRLTAIGVALPLWIRITRVARRERLLGRRDVHAALALGGSIHAVAVSQQVYFVTIRRRRGLQ